jgi:hypothetical protein
MRNAVENCGKAPRITLPRALPRYRASTFTPWLRVPQIRAYTSPQEANMPTQKNGSKKPQRKRETKTIQVTARVTASLYQQIEAIAVEEDRTVANVARHLMSAALKLVKTRGPLRRGR